MTFYYNNTAWKMSKYGPEKTPYLDIFHAVQNIPYCFLEIPSSIKTNYILTMN